MVCFGETIVPSIHRVDGCRFLVNNPGVDVPEIFEHTQPVLVGQYRWILHNIDNCQPLAPRQNVAHIIPYNIKTNNFWRNIGQGID